MTSAWDYTESSGGRVIWAWRREFEHRAWDVYRLGAMGINVRIAVVSGTRGHAQKVCEVYAATALTGAIGG